MNSRRCHCLTADNAGYKCSLSLFLVPTETTLWCDHEGIWLLRLLFVVQSNIARPKGFSCGLPSPPIPLCRSPPPVCSSLGLIAVFSWPLSSIRRRRICIDRESCIGSVVRLSSVLEGLYGGELCCCWSVCFRSCIRMWLCCVLAGGVQRCPTANYRG